MITPPPRPNSPATVPPKIPTNRSKIVVGKESTIKGDPYTVMLMLMPELF